MTPFRGRRSWCALASLALSLTLTAPESLHGATARLLVDADTVGPGPAPTGFYRPPSQFATVGGRAVFFVESSDDDFYRPTPGPGIMLWASDGTEEGTELIAGYCTDELAGCRGGPRFLGQVGAAVLFEAPRARGDFDRELWRTDGTREGTFLLQPDICSQPFPTGATEVIAGGSLFFAGVDADAGCELWRSDGTAAGTNRVSDVDPGGLGSVPHAFAALGGRVFFTPEFAVDGQTGLWVTDGTSGGTSLVAGFPAVELLTAVGGRLFFVARDSTAGFALWVSDGTAAGTRALRHFAVYALCTGPHDCDPETAFLQPDGDGVVFLANDGDGRQFWRSDGTPEGTQRLTSLPEPATPGFDGPGIAVRLPGSLVLRVAPNGAPVRLWTSRGGPASPLAGCPGGCPSVSSLLVSVPGGRRAVFAGSRSISRGTELWATDGTAAGTHLVSDLCAGHCSSAPDNFLALGDAVFFTTADKSGPGLWRTDGTKAGTIYLGRAAFSPSRPPGGAALGDQAVLGLMAGSRVSELWVTAGSAATTRPVATFDRAASSSNPHFASLGNRVVFTTSKGGVKGTLWSSDGVTTRPLTTTSQMAGGPFASFSIPVVAGGRAFVWSGNLVGATSFRAHLVTTDGTPAGTRAIADLDNVLAQAPQDFGGRLVFATASNDAQRLSLWSSDGTAAGTVPWLSLPSAGINGIRKLAVADGLLYFFFSVDGGLSLFRSDGTAAGTTSFGGFDDGDLAPEVAAVGGRVYFTAGGFLHRLDGAAVDSSVFAGFSEVQGLTELDGRLLFFGLPGGDSPQPGLWSSDGTAAGTSLLAQVSAQPPGLVFDIPSWPRAGGKLLFRGWDADHGFELWTTDGTAAGTTPLDIAAGSASSFPGDFAVAAGRVWFTANDQLHGREIWVSDGTPAGTHLATELAPGLLSALPSELTPAGGNLFFSAYTPLAGLEPWVLPLAGVP